MLLITGGNGFLGTYLIQELLAQNYTKIRLLVRDISRSEYQNHPKIQLVEGDILDVMALDKAMEGVTQVIHAAAKVSFDPQNRAEMKRTNVEGTANVVNACLEHQVEKLVFVSSIAALGRSDNKDLITEQTTWKESPLNTHYAISKRKAELEVFRGMEEGLNVVILNPGLVLGGEKWDNSSARFFGIVAKGLPVYNKGINGVVGAEDVARAIRCVLEKDTKNGDRFILVAQNMSQQEMFSLIAQSLKKTPPRYELPPILAKILGFILENWSRITGKPALITRETVRTSLNQYFYDGTKITRTFGFHYTPIPEIIAKTGTRYLETHSI